MKGTSAGKTGICFLKPGKQETVQLLITFVVVVVVVVVNAA